MFENIYKNKKVLVTGHTGFKGSWLTTWLLKLGARVSGLSDKIPTQPSMFEVLELEQFIDHNIIDIRNFDEVSRIINKIEPDFIFHLAAQSIVSSSYEDPLNTISTNVLGTAVLLEAVRKWNGICNVVVITSDKCYENVEWEWGYKETDQLGGRDIYSGSKGATEAIFHSYYASFFHKPDCKQRVASARAGNVIGGGDWAKDRIIVDCIRNWSNGKEVEIRSPEATRPWQHVLEPLSGYLTLGASLYNSKKYCGESFNFGPRFEKSRTVLNLLQDLSNIWFKDGKNAFRITENIPFHEAGLLKLNCEKAMYKLDWEATLNYEDCVKFVGNWYVNFYKNKIDMLEFTNSQISEYEKNAELRKFSWTRN
jgi:CDP-glucose 4,6-dehydratase